MAMIPNSVVSLLKAISREQRRIQNNLTLYSVNKDSIKTNLNSLYSLLEQDHLHVMIHLKKSQAYFKDSKIYSHRNQKRRNRNRNKSQNKNNSLRGNRSNSKVTRLIAPASKNRSKRKRFRNQTEIKNKNSLLWLSRQETKMESAWVESLWKLPRRINLSSKTPMEVKELDAPIKKLPRLVESVLQSNKNLNQGPRSSTTL